MLIIKMEYKVRNFRFPLKVLQNNKNQQITDVVC